MAKRKRRSFTKEYKAEVVDLIRRSGKTVGAVSRELDLTETAVRERLKQAEVDEAPAGIGALSSAEGTELNALPPSPRPNPGREYSFGRPDPGWAVSAIGGTEQAAKRRTTHLDLAPFRVRRQTVGMTSNALRQALFKLSTTEKLELVEELWDSIPEEDEALEMTAEQREDLDRRLAEADADPDCGVPWEEARERIRQRRR